MLRAYKISANVSSEETKGGSVLEVMATHPSSFTRREEIYGRKFGLALTLDVFSPVRRANGAAVLFIVSEGWYSDHAKIDENVPAYVAPFVDAGYTVFAVCHGGNPKFSLPDYIEDVHRAVRFIRYHAKRFGIDGNRIGSTGDSAGAHLSLMLGCTGRDGDPTAVDPIDRETSRIQAVVGFFPPTDFLNWGMDGQRMLGDHPTVPVRGAFEFQRFDDEMGVFRPIKDVAEREALGREVSPRYQVTAAAAPTLLIHGDADDLIPVQQSYRMAERLREAGVRSELIVVPGGGHDGDVIAAHLSDAVAWFNMFLSPDPGGSGL